MVKDFLPISKKDMKKRGWEQCDFVYVIGDAYVDHSSFGPAIISRLLEAFGYKVGIIAQPHLPSKFLARNRALLQSQQPMVRWSHEYHPQIQSLLLDHP